MNCSPATSLPGSEELVIECGVLNTIQNIV